MRRSRVGASCSGDDQPQAAAGTSNPMLAKTVHKRGNRTTRTPSVELYGPGPDQRRESTLGPCADMHPERW
jgi:hypothetical protein